MGQSAQGRAHSRRPLMACRHPRGLPATLLADGAAAVAPGADRGRDPRGAGRPSSHHVCAPCRPRPGECLVLLRQGARACCRDGRLRRRATDRRPLLVIDGDSFAHRSYHALPKSIRRAGDLGGGAVLGFANFLLRLVATEKPRAVIVGWDTLETATYRQELFPDYQGGREFDDELVEQLEALPEFVAACGFANAKGGGYEADDFLASAAKREERNGGTVLVASGDRDAFQLASERTTVLYPLRAGEMARIGPAEVRERYGVDPAQVPDFIALRGDPSDRLPGARGVGAKGAADLLRRYGTLERVLASGRFAAQAADLRLYKKIATMDAKAPLPKLGGQTPTWDKAAALAREWGLNQLAARLDKLASASEPRISPSPLEAGSSREADRREGGGA